MAEKQIRGLRRKHPLESLRVGRSGVKYPGSASRVRRIPAAEAGRMRFLAAGGEAPADRVPQDRARGEQGVGERVKGGEVRAWNGGTRPFACSGVPPRVRETLFGKHMRVGNPFPLY